MPYGVTPQMIDTYGDLVFQLSLNKQRRRGDPIRQLDFAAIEAQRADAGLADSQIAERLGLTVAQARYIRVVMERRRFRRDQYRKLFELGVGKRYREGGQANKPREFGETAMKLREAMVFDPKRVQTFVKAGWWNSTTLSSWLAKWAKETPDKAAIVHGDQIMSYRQLATEVNTLAAQLQRLGVQAGDVVAVQLPNIPEFLISYLAICHLGGVMSTLHMPYRTAEFQMLLSHNQARAVICLSKFKDFPTGSEMVGIKEKLATLEHVICLGDPVAGAESWASLMAKPSKQTVACQATAADPFLLLYTSGTSSSPKGVPLSYQNMLSNARVGVGEHQLSNDDLILSAAPYSHLFGLYSFHLALACGATNQLLPAFTPPDLGKLLESSEATALFTAPAHIAACFGLGVFAQRTFPHLTLTIMSGSACPPDLFPRFQAIAPNCKVGQLWGMTECQAGLYTRPDDPLAVAANSAGRPSPGTEARIVSLAGDILAAGEEGELQVRGCSVFPGYFDNEAANTAAFTPDGWFQSGDLATMDATGNVSIVGRLKDIINRGGVKFNPLDVEQLLDRHPKLLQTAVVPMPDPILGERACCFAVLKPNATTPTLDELIDYLLDQGIAKFKLPERLEIIEEMPLTPTRKIIRGRLLVQP
ncbi:MAG: class I adenylate-forming enzyme family protein [Chloroflexota bacterium]